MTPIVNEDARNQRADNLQLAGFNGCERVIVTVFPAASPSFAVLRVQLFNTLHRNTLVAAGNTPARAAALFRILGGIRVRAGLGVGQVRTVAVSADPEPDTLRLRVEPIGDYSTYTLVLEPSAIDPSLGLPAVAIDPLLGDLPFKFRPGCFTNNCAPEWEPGAAPKPSPAIDYLAKDFDSFRHTLIAAMMSRVPGWQPTSEADLDQVLLSLTAAVGDELSDYQDRVMNEAYLATCRSRVTLARHARLMDYHVHQGNQATTWVAVELDPTVVIGPLGIPPGHAFWTGEQPAEGIRHRLPGTEIFSTRVEHRLHPILNTLRLYTWDDAWPALAAGSTQADLEVDVTDIRDPVTLALLTEQQGAQLVVQFVRETNPSAVRLRHLVLQEHLNPLTGTVNGRDPAKRQLLELLPGTDGAQVVHDPVRNRFVVRVTWRDEDRLQAEYPAVVFPDGLRVPDVSLFHGNLVRAHHGAFRSVRFLEVGTPLAPDDPAHPTLPVERHFERTIDNRYGVLCPLPHAPLSYLATPVGGEVPPVSTVEVEVTSPGGGAADSWEERPSLVHSDDGTEDGDHFQVETDELQNSVLRFGNGVNGRLLSTGAVVECRYQIGLGHVGNIGADQLINSDRLMVLPPGTPEIRRTWNPFDVTDGVDPEPAARVIRNVPEAYRARQLRAVTVADYVARAEEVPGVSRAAAAYRWTGSWRTVRVTIDPVGTTELRDALRLAVAEHLEAVRLIGEDLEIRPPRFVPLAILVVVCLSPDFWPEDVRSVLEQEFSDGYTPDGRMGFFHPDAWTFGQRLRRSEIEGRVHRVAGIEHINLVSWRRFNEPTPGMYASTAAGPEELFVGPDEIVLVKNDPDHMELGFIRFVLQGGRQ